MTSLGALGGAFFKGGLVDKVVTAYSGNSFPTYNPNPIFRQAYESGEVEVEHWSILTLSQRLEAAARGLPAAVTGSLVGSSMADNEAFAVVESPFGPLGLLAAPRARRRAGPCRRRRPVGQPRLLRAPARWRLGRLGGPARRRGDGRAGGRRPRGSRAPGQGPGPPRPGRGGGALRRPPGGLLRPRPAGPQLRRGHRALERGRRRGGQGPSSTPTSTSGCSVRRRTRTTWRGSGRTSSSGSKAARTPCRGRPTPTPTPSSRTPPSRAGSRRRRSGPASSSGWSADVGADAVLAGAGVANLAAWVAVGRARAAGRNVMLTAELGLWGYQPTPADPYIFNQRVFPATPYLSDASAVLGMVIGGPGTTTVGCLGAAEVDRDGSSELHPARRADASWSAPVAPTTSPAGPRPASWSPWPGPSVFPRPSPTSRRRDSGSSAW